MKQLIKLFTCLTLFLLLSTTVVGQQCNGITLNRNIELDGSSDTEEIKVEVSKDTTTLFIGINSTIQSGQLTIELYDPKGNKHGNFSVESQLKSNKSRTESVCGQMQKQIKDPVKGDWIVKLIPNKVIGNVSICTSLTEQN